MKTKGKLVSVKIGDKTIECQEELTISFDDKPKDKKVEKSWTYDNVNKALGYL